MDILNVLTKRHSVKKFSDKEIADSLIEKIVTAGLYAPSGMNKQAVKFLVVKNKDIVKKIASLNASVMNFSNDPFYNAPVVIVVFASKNVRTYIEDGSLALGNMLNEAYSLGVDSCWIHRAYETFETEEGRQIAKDAGIPDDYVGIGNCILGYRDGDFGTKPRQENRVFYIK